MGAGAHLIPKVLFQIAVLSLVFVAFLFGAAGTWDWPSAWAYIALFAVLSVVLSLWLASVDPDLLAERMKSPVQKDQKPWDRLFLGVVAVVYFAWLLLMAVDARRFGWSHVPLWVQIVGALLIVASNLGICWVFRTNSFAAPVIKMQAERRQTVISTGP
jgi:protein-S-isoprenylcysteine O-methyltransferase Ste14